MRCNHPAAVVDVALSHETMHLHIILAYEGQSAANSHTSEFLADFAEKCVPAARERHKSHPVPTVLCAVQKPSLPFKHPRILIPDSFVFASEGFHKSRHVKTLGFLCPDHSHLLIK